MNSYTSPHFPNSPAIPRHSVRSAFLVTILSMAPFLCIGSAIAQAPDSWSPFDNLPTIPKDVNPAAYPFPKIDWFERVKGNDAKAHKIADSIPLVFDGDSITDFWRSSERGLRLWNETYEKINAFDFGIGGDRTQHLLWRLSHGQMDGIHPKLIALMIGTNNIGANTAEQIAGGIKAIVVEYQKRCPEAVILLQAVFPRGEKAEDPNRARIKDINRIIAKLGDGQKVIYMDFGDKFLNPDGSMSKEIMPDFLHPSAKGYQIWADAIAPIINKYVPGK